MTGLGGPHSADHIHKLHSKFLACTMWRVASCFLILSDCVLPGRLHFEGLLVFLIRAIHVLQVLHEARVIIRLQLKGESDKTCHLHCAPLAVAVSIAAVAATAAPGMAR